MEFRDVVALRKVFVEAAVVDGRQPPVAWILKQRKVMRNSGKTTEGGLPRSVLGPRMERSVLGPRMDRSVWQGPRPGGRHSSI